MGTKEKLKDRFLTLPKDFTFGELEKVLSAYGYTKAIKVKHQGRELSLKMEINDLSCCTSHILVTSLSRMLSNRFLKN